MVRKFSTEKSKEITIKVGYPTFHAAYSGMMICCKSGGLFMGGKYSSQKKTKFRRFLSVLYTVFCMILVLLLACNVTIIVKGVVSPERPPSVMGLTPMVVLSGSMSGEREGHIEVGDLIVARNVDAADLAEGDVISFMDGKSAVTHRIIGIVGIALGLKIPGAGCPLHNADDPVGHC